MGEVLKKNYDLRFGDFSPHPALSQSDESGILY